jgi:hypothetical protein
LFQRKLGIGLLLPSTLLGIDAGPPPTIRDDDDESRESIVPEWYWWEVVEYAGDWAWLRRLSISERAELTPKSMSSRRDLARSVPPCGFRSTLACAFFKARFPLDLSKANGTTHETTILKKKMRIKIIKNWR